MPSIQEIEALGYYQEASPLQQTSTRYPVVRGLASQQTLYADAVIVENGDYGRMLFLDHELQSSSYDEQIYHETLVHPLMHSLGGSGGSGGDGKNLLVVGGAEGATVREVLKWAVRHVDWVDIDGELVKLCREHLRYTPDSVYDDKRVSYYAADIMNFLDNMERVGLYDAIIIDLPDPDPTSHVLYGETFWKLIHRSLKMGGGIVSHVGPVEPGRRPGLEMVRAGAGGGGHAFHTYVPSFQGEWGFWMNKEPAFDRPFDLAGCGVVDDAYLRTVFHWDRHWGHC